ncbi:protein rep, partial [Klebsiella pneumoniae]
SRWFFLSLTVRTCAIAELGETLTRMNMAFQRLKDRKEFRPVQGCIRTTEVTRGSYGSSHPHFHTLMMIPPSIFTLDYFKHYLYLYLYLYFFLFNYYPNVYFLPLITRNPTYG